MSARGHNPVETIKEVRSRFGLGLAAARALVVTPDMVKAFVKEQDAAGLSRLEARSIVKRQFACSGKEALAYIDSSGLWSHVTKNSIANTTLYRPVGPEELTLIEKSGWSAFPPRLPEQPIFYPVTNEAYATQIARDWNTKHGSKRGFVTKFDVDANYVAKFDRKIVGGREHEELWVPAEELEEFNRHIIGRIEVTQTFEAAD